MKKVIYKDGSHITVKDQDAWEYCNDPDFDKIEDIISDVRFMAVPLRKKELIVFKVGDETVKICLHTKHSFHVVTAVIHCPMGVKIDREPNPIYLSRKDSLSLPDDKKE